MIIPRGIWDLSWSEERTFTLHTSASTTQRYCQEYAYTQPIFIRALPLSLGNELEDDESRPLTNAYPLSWVAAMALLFGNKVEPRRFCVLKRENVPDSSHRQEDQKVYWTVGLTLLTQWVLKRV